MAATNRTFTVVAPAGVTVAMARPELPSASAQTQASKRLMVSPRYVGESALLAHDPVVVAVQRPVVVLSGPVRVVVAVEGPHWDAAGLVHGGAGADAVRLLDDDAALLSADQETKAFRGDSSWFLHHHGPAEMGATGVLLGHGRSCRRHLGASNATCAGNGVARPGRPTPGTGCHRGLRGPMGAVSLRAV